MVSPQREQAVRVLVTGTEVARDIGKYQSAIMTEKLDKDSDFYYISREILPQSNIALQS